MERSGPLSGRVVLLTGADGPDGAVTRRLLAQGARVAVAGPTVGAGLRVLALVCDPDDPVDLSRAVDTVVRRFGRLDHVVNLMPVRPSAGPLMELDPLALRGSLQHNLVTPLAWIQRSYWRWMAEHGGTVVNVVADVVREAPQGAALAALAELTEWLSAELAPRVDVCSVVPGPSLGAVTYRAAIPDVLTDLLARPQCSGDPGACPDLVHGPVLVLTDQFAGPRCAA
ncbi:SDR family NAD(P)-dependent oxidoreductase [Streptomyces sp. DSM 41524]|uniref:SDR family NAD(P)-dependent oxidoreductase n=1 Tax=Streptomyces asiaticus subsp. ignotus TaxID=3098222 RepID=A0ABU7Q5A6_9ACTN|nr:SDR family NAD(P)-dependent oxidoreductase [Streptomyces sp. DSM 41524]